MKEKSKRRYLIKVFNYLISGHREVKARLFSEVHAEKRQDGWHKLQQKNFFLDIRKKILRDSGQTGE